MTVSWHAAGGTDVGRVRETNEDAFRIDQDAGVFIVADGMGGHAAGEVASRIAADTALEVLREVRGKGPNPQERLREAFREASRRISACCHDHPETTGMGTTLTAAVLDPSGTLHIGHIGDSRLYRFSGAALTQLTHDHSWVQQEVDAGRIPPEAARSHPFAHILTRVLSTGENTGPDLHHTPLQPGEQLLLCSDGLYNMVTPDRMLEIVRSGTALDETVQRLVERANDEGGVDNITVVLVQIES